MDLASATNQPIEIPIAGKTYIVNRGSARTVGELQNWVNQQPEPPKARVQNIAQLPGPLAALIVKEEAQIRSEWPPEVASPQGWKAMYTLNGGMTKLLFFALKKGQPNITETETDALMDELTYQQLQRIGIFFLQGVDIESPLALSAIGQETNGDNLPNKITVPTAEPAAAQTPATNEIGSS
jgi:hypothetical protein